MDGESLDATGCLVGPSGERVCPLGKSSPFHHQTYPFKFHGMEIFFCMRKLRPEGEFFKNLETWNLFHGVDSNCGINSKLASIPKVGAGLEQGISCSTLALGWTWFRRLIDEKPLPCLKINILWSMGRPYSPESIPAFNFLKKFGLRDEWVVYRGAHKMEDEDIAPNTCSWSSRYGQKVEPVNHRIIVLYIE